MATKKKRICISVSPELELALGRLSAVSGQPVATVVSQLLEGVLPHLHGMVGALEIARRDPIQAMEGLLSMGVHVMAGGSSALAESERLLSDLRSERDRGAS